MKTKSVYCIVDTVSETVISEFIANNDKVAKKAYDAFLEKQNLVDEKDDFMLVREISFDSVTDVVDVDFANPDCKFVFVD